MSTAGVVVRREINRFVAFARQRSYLDTENRRRAQRRYHRSWPMLVRPSQGHAEDEMSVALHDASATGVGFLSSEPLSIGSRVLIKLFWHDDDAHRVPATVRHATRTSHGWLIGCEFDAADNQRCEEALSASSPWYG